MSSYQTLDWQLADDGILTLWLNRPEALNSFTVTMAEELEAAFNRASLDDDVRAVVVTGRGRAFCVGMDLTKEGNVFGLNESLKPTLEDMDNPEDPRIHQGVRDTGGRVTLAIYNCRKPVIAAINGAAVGIGATMTLAMDFRLAATNARIGFVFGKLAIVPEACSSWFLPRIVGIQQALEWVYSADILTAQQALAGRLLRSVHAPETLLEDAKALARKLTCNRSAVATALAKQMLYRNSAKEHPLEAHRIDSLAMFYTSIEDGKEGVSAFLQKRAPNYTSKASKMPDFYEQWLAEDNSFSL